MVQPIELRYFLFSSYNHIGKRIIICRECAKKNTLAAKYNIVYSAASACFL